MRSGELFNTKPPRAPRILRTRPAVFKERKRCSRYLSEICWRAATSLTKTRPCHNAARGPALRVSRICL
jgi:hypothetical protein